MNNELINPKLKTGALIKSIYESQYPERLVITIPAQTIVYALKQQGLLGSADLIEMASLDQVRVLIDLDCWNKDNFSEDVFWDWLSLTDANENLEILQKIVHSVDLKLVGLLISRHTDIVIFDEPSENPPGVNYYTPDNGSTWILIKLEDADKHFLLGRLLALIFETNIELFYQLIAIPNVSTDSILEEEAYQDRNRRLSAEGIPDLEYSGDLNTPITFIELLEIFKQNNEADPSKVNQAKVPIILPLVNEGYKLTAIEELSNAVEDKEQFQSELSLISNCAIVHWGVTIDDFDELIFTINRVKGILNIGIESLKNKTEFSDKENFISLYDAVGLRGIYRYGLSLLNKERKIALKIITNLKKEDKFESLEFTKKDFITGVSQYVPVVPKWFDSEWFDSEIQIKEISSKDSNSAYKNESKEIEESKDPVLKLRSGFTAIQDLAQLNKISEILNSF